MIHRRFENTDLDLSAITFGAWAIGGWMWGGADRKDALDALAAAIDSGITTIDTAPVYGFGLSEQIVGEAIKGKRNNLQIITKYGLRWNDEKGQFHFNTKSAVGKPIEINRCSKKESILRECEESLKNLGTDHIDLYIMHWPDNTLPMSEPMEAMEILVKQGKIRYAGLSNCDAALVEEARKYFPIVTDQVPYSMVNRDVEKELIPWCVKNHVGILAYSPLQRGVLTGKMKIGHAFGEDDSRPNTPFYKEPAFSRILAFVDSLRPIADARGITVGELVINWTVQRQGIVSVLVGARNRTQVLDNVKAVDFMLSKEELDAINDKIEKLGNPVG